MQMIGLAFYCGSGTLTDRIVRAATRSQFSHVELVDMGTLQRFSVSGLREANAISASWRDGGVREARIVFDPNRWHVLPLQPWHRVDARDRARECLGMPYDLTGILLSQVVNMHRQGAGHWFCSELCAHAIGFAKPHTLAPGDLLARATEMNHAFERGIQHHLGP